VEAAHEHKEVVLEIDVEAHVENQLITQIEILRKLQSTKNKGAEVS